MDDTLITNAEPQVVETDNSAVVSQDINVTPQDDGSQVIEQPTPMDDNVTYNDIPEQTINTNRDLTQNLVQQAVDVNRENSLVNNNGAAMDNFLNNEYSYDHNEAGTYWVAGAINDVDTQMSFLNTLIREEMYDEMDLQKYYYDTTMATARAYAAQKKKETAYGFYRAAQEKAIAEAALTGWYMPAEGNYMLGQYTVAQNKLEDPNTPADQLARAQRISNTVEKWFAANQIGTRGIKCLNMMNYEENVRHNTIMGELQHQANQIAAQQAAAGGAASYWDDLQFKFDVEELELKWGIDLTKDNYLGHNIWEDTDYKGKFEHLSGARDVKKLAETPEHYNQMLNTRNTQWLKDVLGNKFTETERAYQKDVDATLRYKAAEDESRIGTDSFRKSGYTYDGYDIKWIWNDDGSQFMEYTDGDGVSHQLLPSELKEGDIKTSKGKAVSVKEFTTKFNMSTNSLTSNGTEIPYGDKLAYDKLNGSVTKNATDMSDSMRKTAEKLESKKGMHRLDGYEVEETFWDKAFGSVKPASNLVFESDDGKSLIAVDVYGGEHKINRDQLVKTEYYDAATWDKVRNYLALGDDTYLAKDTKGNAIIYQKSENSTAFTREVNRAAIKADQAIRWSLLPLGNVLGTIAGEAAVNQIGLDTYVKIDAEEYFKTHPEAKQMYEAMNTYSKGFDTKVETKTHIDEKTIESKPGSSGGGHSSGGGAGRSFDGGHSSGGGAGRSFDGYEAQDTVTNRYGLFEKYNVDLLEQPKYADIRDLDKLEEALQERNNINSFNQTKTTYTKPKVQKKGGK